MKFPNMSFYFILFLLIKLFVCLFVNLLFCNIKMLFVVFTPSQLPFCILWIFICVHCTNIKTHKIKRIPGIWFGTLHCCSCWYFKKTKHLCLSEINVINKENICESLNRFKQNIKEQCIHPCGGNEVVCKPKAHTHSVIQMIDTHADAHAER